MSDCKTGGWCDPCDSCCKRVENLVKAAKAVHDECSSFNGKLLNMGPMMEPSERSILSLRAALAEFEKEGREG